MHVVDEEMLNTVVSSVSEPARALIDAFWPGPLTLVLQKQPSIPSLVTSGLPTVAVRMPAHPVARELLSRAAVPLAAPSANPFGYLSPTRAQHVERMLGSRVDMIVDGGPTEYGVESTIVMLEPQPTLLRAGAIAAESIEAIVGPLSRELSDEAKPLAPGRLPQHYAPRTPINILDPNAPMEERRGAGLLAFREAQPGYDAVRILSENGDIREAASHLFECLHELDELGLERIDADPVPEKGIGVAIMDRLRRASTR